MKSTAPAGMFYTPAQVAELLQISPKSVIARFAELEGVLVLPDTGEGKRKERERYRQIRISKPVLDRFIENITNQASTLLSTVRNLRTVRTRRSRAGVLYKGQQETAGLNGS
jgi:hypothetical protein